MEISRKSMQKYEARYAIALRMPRYVPAAAGLFSGSRLLRSVR
jgi:hypothetical protein